MPSGKTHERINVLSFYFLLFSSVLIGSFYLFGNTYSLYIGLFVFSYFFGTYYLSPDLDTKSAPYYRWGKLRFIWYPYRKLFRHRSFWTHGFVIGDVIRVLYLGIILFLVYSIVLTTLNGDASTRNIELIHSFHNRMELFLVGLSGLILASTLHIISDHLSTSMKRRKTRKRKKRK